MPESAELAVVLGGLANLGLALVRMFGLQGQGAQLDKLPGRAAMSRTSMVLMIYRQMFVFFAFGALSLLHARELASTPLGFTLVVTMALFLLLKAGEHIYVPEVRRERLRFEFALAVVGGAAYVWAATSGI